MIFLDDDVNNLKHVVNVMDISNIALQPYFTSESTIRYTTTINFISQNEPLVIVLTESELLKLS